MEGIKEYAELLTEDPIAIFRLCLIVLAGKYTYNFESGEFD